MSKKREGARDPFFSGYVSITGRPNVGKSTLLNGILGQKLSIVTSKPQTTRNRILGIKNLPGVQMIFLDTPGIHRPKHGLGEFMVREARQAIKDVDVVLLLVEPVKPSKEDAFLIRSLKEIEKPVILLVNKLDKVRKTEMLPIIAEYARLFEFDSIIPISALKGDGVNEVLDRIKELLPEGPRYYPEGMITDNVERFLVAEMLREKVMLETSDEVPHSTAVDVTEWDESKGRLYVRADILVEKPGQKGIIIGKKGARLKSIGTTARADIEALLGTKVFLELFVRIEAEWRRRRSVLKDLGFEE